MNTDIGNQKFREGWKAFEKLLLNKLNSMKQANDGGEEFNWWRLLGESLDRLEQMSVSGLTTDIFETHRSVIVRIRLPANAFGCKPSVVVGNRHVTVAGIPGKRVETIPLPEKVTVKRSRAELSKGILEIRLRKQRLEKPEIVVKCSSERVSL
ncbi:Hsp20/alpha crystallin family protein [Paenibacillus thermotolerans]|uniref:Hsp20/alpha crystallin family protein n=1 Tax=Paenibacillus thermotolerans TaxID=3027807 RepID=UPI002367FA3E|nr:MULTISPECIES: Hsp20/alpha crystallin family protein [unclassified Paenibacillus]